MYSNSIHVNLKTVFHVIFRNVYNLSSYKSHIHSSSGPVDITVKTES